MLTIPSTAIMSSSSYTRKAGISFRMIRQNVQSSEVCNQDGAGRRSTWDWMMKEVIIRRVALITWPDLSLRRDVAQIPICLVGIASQQLVTFQFLCARTTKIMASLKYLFDPKPRYLAYLSISAVLQEGRFAVSQSPLSRDPSVRISMA